MTCFRDSPTKRVADLDFTHPITITEGPAPWRGAQVIATAPLLASGIRAFVRIDVDGAQRYAGTCRDGCARRYRGVSLWSAPRDFRRESVVTAVSGREFTHAVRLLNAAPPFDGLIVRSAGDPLRSTGAFVVYDLDGTTRHGYILTRLVMDVRGERWGMGLLYDVDSSADAALPSSPAALDSRFRQRAEIEFRYA